MKDILTELGYSVQEAAATRIIYKSCRAELPGLIDRKDTVGMPSPLCGRGQIHLIEPDLVLRTLTHGGTFARLSGERFLSPDRSLRELEISAYLRARGIPTPEILALRFIRSGLFYHITVITKMVPDSVDLLTYLEGAPEDSLPILRQTGALIKKMHAAGVYHADLHLKNILLDRDKTPWMLDLDKAYRFSTLGAVLERKTLGRFIHSGRKWQKKSRITLPEGWESAVMDGYAS